MDKILQKLARQLNSFDEASLMALWEKYAAQVQHFEPTRRWEEATLIFGFIQAMRWKNQLFNYNWAQTSRPKDMEMRSHSLDPLLADVLEGPAPSQPGQNPAELARQRAKVLQFKPRDDNGSPCDSEAD